MNNVMSKDFLKLQKISYEIGSNIDLIQGAGGNTSLKENGVLWVKASGCWLSGPGSLGTLGPAFLSRGC